MTHAATRFITPLTLASLTGNKVLTDLFASSSAEETLTSSVAHIDVAQQADLLLVAPATADILAKFALGLADDFLSTAHLAFQGPVVLAPAMNTRMWEHPATRENLQALRRRGAAIVEPDEGDLACGTVGIGRLADVPRIVEAVRQVLASGNDLSSECVLVTAGPTRESLDPVRYLSNRSSGRMGFAIAEEAARRGARVILVSGPVDLQVPPRCECTCVESAGDMHRSVLRHLEEATIAVMAAAVADYRPRMAADRKLKKHDGPPELRLEETPDILRDVCLRKGDRFVIGFAAETHDLEANARQKLESKRCDMIVANPVGGATGFESELNQGILLAPGAKRSLPIMPKAHMAASILDFVHDCRRRKAA